ncbi:hypothetical protein KC354_g12255 [Hortaea werneckii]|nr:hypothetical protein KC354_g12255 [Hortaea werneckii]
MNNMMTSAVVLAILSSAIASPTPNMKRAGEVQGFDISHYQSNVNFESAYDGGLRFVYIKATEGTDYTDPKFSDHYTAATDAGFIRGGYHYAHGTASATTQANFFADNGGGWTNDGRTLPGMLDMEGSCAGFSDAWVEDFNTAYHAKTGRYPVIYTSPAWWKDCMGDSSAFVDTNPLNLAHYASSAGTPPGGWPYYTFWQYNAASEYGGDSDVFNGDLTQLKKLATG